MANTETLFHLCQSIVEDFRVSVEGLYPNKSYFPTAFVQKRPYGVRIVITLKDAEDLCAQHLVRVRKTGDLTYVNEILLSLKYMIRRHSQMLWAEQEPQPNFVDSDSDSSSEHHMDDNTWGTLQTEKEKNTSEVVDTKQA